ncbi:MAG: glycosyltransferase family 4 protein, partial [Solirubrobacteraceae bacterium]
RWPASAVALGALSNPHAIAAASALERWIYRHAQLITAPTEGIVAALAPLAQARGKAQRVWPVVDLERFDPRPPAPADNGARAPLRLLWAGTVGLAHGLDVLVEAARLAGPEALQATIAGDGADAPRIRAIVAQRRVTNVKLLGAVAADRVPGLYADADASAVLLRDLPIFEGALPTKMLEAMAAARPLVLAARGEAARLVTTAGAGVVVVPGEPQELADACRRLHADPQLRRALGAAGRRYAETHFGAARAAEQWAMQLDAALARHGAKAVSR